ncbi:HSF-type DNA-binding-domain-containing protein [Crepidotus variabilis]|uniref:HSF-type DNA-binding-domain-containing protein n=1 Tax=Crepidotus variabilis TaxID=179855 RepID=A0A9P6ETQ5_9AGAR|nr:HSF-type DNA-binding-domain-containing protein [Crepidotus variabilis]
MADLYPPNYDSRYPATASSSNSSDENNDAPPSPAKSPDHQQKTEAKPQATFLTKLYALLERPENHHMIRWDPAGEHIIVERPEQLALHVLPSIYRQSRFASFSRQLNIYGFMRKVNLRNVDPAIDDPDASTWSHPTLNRHSPPEVVANFKRRVPPRLPKPRKRDIQEQPQSIPPPPRSAIGMGPVPLTVPSSMHPSHKLMNSASGRSRGFSLPSSMAPLNQGGAAGWGNNYNRMYSTPHTLHTDDSPSSNFHPISNYSSSTRDMVVPSNQYSNTEQNSWSNFSNGYSGSSSHNGSLSSLLNPSSNGYSRPAPTIQTNYSSPFSSMPLQGEHSASSLSPDSRPTTGYSMASVSSMPYQDDYSRPGSSHHRPISPARPTSSKSNYTAGSLSVRRPRRHSQAMSPYPNPYDSADQRPSTSPAPIDDHQSSNGGMPRVRSMIQLPSVDPYNFNSSQAEFAYSAIPNQVAHSTSMDSMNDTNGAWTHRNVRPSTSTSSISAASHTSSSQANTPPIPENYNGETDINRCEFAMFIRRFPPSFFGCTLCWPSTRHFTTFCSLTL